MRQATGSFPFGHRSPNDVQDEREEEEYIELALMADRSVQLVPPTVQVFVGYQSHGNQSIAMAAKFGL